MAISREEHLAWAKRRALKYLDAGDTVQALTSMMSDLEQHEETRGHIGTQLGIAHLMAGLLRTPGDMRRFIEGFN